MLIASSAPHHAWFLGRRRRILWTVRRQELAEGGVLADMSEFATEDYLADLRTCVEEVGGTRIEDRSTNYATLE